MIYRLWNRRKRQKEPDLPPAGSRDRQFRGLFAGVPLIIACVIVSVLLLLILLHSRFISRVNDCREGYISYPNMQIITEEQPYFLQPTGTLRTELYSPDPPDEVETWLNRARAAVMRQAVISGDFRDLPDHTWTIEETESGGSSIIVYCG